MNPARDCSHVSASSREGKMSRRLSALFVRKVVKPGAMESLGKHIGSARTKEVKATLGKYVLARILKRVS